MENKIIIFDFGSQTCHLIARRIKDFGVEVKIINPDFLINNIFKEKPAGIIFSGGPASVYQKSGPKIDKKIFDLKIPILGICYGQHLISHLMGGQVKLGTKKEFGPAEITVSGDCPLFKFLPKKFIVWMSHGDKVLKLPKGFISIAQTKTIKNAAIANIKRKIYGLQFHPEVAHTEFGQEILKNFVQQICGLSINKKGFSFSTIVKDLKTQVGNQKVICAVSGGVDSTITAILLAKAIGNNLFPIYIESGLMRLDNKEEIIALGKKYFPRPPKIVKAQGIFLQRLKKIVDPEEKRKVIGKLYIDLFEREAKKIKGVGFLAQGTIYSDVIESKGTKAADKIKSHHNVGGLPKNLKLKLIEPLRNFYKDEVRIIGEKLDLPKEIIYKQVFPGPGQAIRITGEVTKQRLEKQRLADKIVLEEIKNGGFYYKVFMSFAVLTNTKSTAVKGDAREFGEVVAVRIIESKDVMTASWSKLPYDLLEKISTRIVNEVRGVSRVVYDITTKPPATMEWE